MIGPLAPLASPPRKPPAPSLQAWAGAYSIYWYALAGAMVCAFAGHAWVRCNFPAIGKLEGSGATIP